MFPLPVQNESLNRQHIIEKISGQKGEWDIIVIGGGATGLGIAFDAVSRGYKTLLIEQLDFAKGTSSRSTKLVHGGVRYLAQGHIRLVREASIERGILHQNAPHLVKNQTFIVPVYSLWDKIKYSIGLKIYDLIAGRLRLGASVFISQKELINLMPGLNSKGLKGGIKYHDGQFDDSRLAINLVQSIIEKGGTALNYVKVTGLLKDKNGRLNGVQLQEAETGLTFTQYGKAIVNATGVFVDDILQMDNPNIDKSIRVSQGVHIVLDKKFHSSEQALMIPKTSDGRVLFAVPWHNKIIVGTTDTPVTNPSLEPKALESEIDFILHTASEYLIKQPTKKDILSVFAGLRPLAAPKENQTKTKEISRSHKILVSPSKLFTLLGGKWTTFRKMGEDLIDKIEKELHWPKKKSESATVPIHGYTTETDWDDPFYFYGSDAAKIKSLINNNDWISQELQIHKAQVIWAVQHEMAITVEDVLARRTRALFLNAKESKRIAPEVAEIMAQLLGKDAKWKAQQIENFYTLCNQYILH